jgi:peptidoglycan pentaglycine glycine transferase (the first glycine)
MTLRYTRINERDRWNALLCQMPNAHILQSWEWGEIKRDTTGWHPLRLAFYENDSPPDGPVALASLGVRRVGPLRLLYISKGPAMRYDQPALLDDMLRTLAGIAKQQHAIWLKIDPDVLIATGVPGDNDATAHPSGQDVMQLLAQRGWQYSADQVQFRNTVTLDLTQSADDLLAAMSQSTRRKVRTAAKKGVSIRTGTLDDLPLLYELYAGTGQRDDFTTRPYSYYEQAWRTLMQAGMAQAFIAEYAHKPLAHVLLYHFGRTCWYFIGASADEERQRMPNYALQWHAIQWAQARGYALYDMWGAPDVFDESDSLWGVWQFKRGFRGTVRRHIGAWDYAPYPLLYRAFTRGWPRLRALLRRRA